MILMHQSYKKNQAYEKQQQAYDSNAPCTWL